MATTFDFNGSPVAYQYYKTRNGQTYLSKRIRLNDGRYINREEYISDDPYIKSHPTYRLFDPNKNDEGELISDQSIIDQINNYNNFDNTSIHEGINYPNDFDYFNKQTSQQSASIDEYIKLSNDSNLNQQYLDYQNQQNPKDTNFLLFEEQKPLQNQNDISLNDVQNTSLGSNVGEISTDPPQKISDFNTRNAYTSIGKYGDYAIQAGKYIGQAIGEKEGNIVSDTAQGIQTTINSAKNLKFLSRVAKGTKGLGVAKASNIMGIVGAGSDIARNFLQEKTEYSGDKGQLTNTIDNIYDGVSDALMSIPGWGMLAGGIMKGADLLGQGFNTLGGGTDGMTTTDAILGSSLFNWNFGLINGFGGRKVNTITKDKLTFDQIGSSYLGSNETVDDAVHKSGKKYGLFSSGVRRKADQLIQDAKLQQNIMSDIAEESRNRFAIQNAMSNIYGNRRNFLLNGGYDQSSVRIGKSGMQLVKKIRSYNKIRNIRKSLEPNIHQSNILEIKLSPISEFKDGGSLTITNTTINEIILDNNISEIQLIDSITKFQDGGLIEENIEKENPIQYSINRFPILASLEPINLQYDPNFNPREIGDYGDIEYMQSKHDILPYYNNYPKKEEYKGKSTIVYNDKINPKYLKEAIALDWLTHGLREYDEDWQDILNMLSNDKTWNHKIIDQLFGIYLDQLGIKEFDKLPDSIKNQLIQEFDKQEINEENFNSILDGLIRGILINDDNYRENNNYAPIEEYQDLINTPVWRQASKHLFGSEKYKQGGKFNVIPEGALHARLHHMEDNKNITKKGIPVISENENGEIEQQAEIEKEEIILRLSLTKKLEQLAKENTDESAIEAGKILVNEILFNTIDNTNKLI